MKIYDFGLTLLAALVILGGIGYLCQKEETKREAMKLDRTSIIYVMNDDLQTQSIK